MASAGSGTGDVFEKFAKFGKTESQVKEMKGGLRMETRNVQKLMKESGVIDAKYSTQLLDNDISKHHFGREPFEFINKSDGPCCI